MSDVMMSHYAVYFIINCNNHYVMSTNEVHKLQQEINLQADYKLSWLVIDERFENRTTINY